MVATLTTIQCSRPGDAYTLSSHGREFDVHLAGPGARGGTGPILCGFDRFARGEDGHWKVGFSVGGGVLGGVTNVPCRECARLAGDARITGSLASVFEAGA